MNYLATTPHVIGPKTEIDLALESFNVTAAPMPQRPRVVSVQTRLRTALLIFGAVLIVMLYIGVPVVAAIHKHLFNVALDIVLFVATTCQIAFFMTYIILKTDGR